MSAKRYKIHIYIYKTKKKKVRKGNSHLQVEERNVASIKYGSPEVLFLCNIPRNSRFLQGQFSLRIVLDLLTGESKPMETL